MGGHSGRLARYDLTTGELLVRFEGHRADVSWAFVWHGNVLSGSAIDREFREWDVESGACLMRYFGASEQLTAALVKPDLPVLVGGDFNGTVYVWVHGMREPRFELRRHTKYIHCFEMDEHFLFSASNDKSIFQWDIELGAYITTLIVKNKTSTHCMLRHKEFLFTANKDKTVRKWNVATSTIEHTWTGHVKTIFDLKVHGNYLFSSSMDKKACQWDLRTYELVRTFENRHWRTIKMLQTDGEFLFTASEDATVSKWSITDGSLLHTIDEHESFVSCLLIDGLDLFVTHDASTFRFLLNDVDASPGQYVTRYEGHSEEVNCIVRSGNFLFSGSRDSSIFQWDLTTNAFVRELRGHQRSVLNLVIHRGLLYSGSLDKTIIVWDAESGVVRARLRGHDKSIQRLLVHDNMLFSGSYDHTLRKWHASTFQPLAEYKGHSKSIKCMLCVGTRLFSGSFDHDVRVWDATTNGLGIQALAHPLAVLLGHRKSVVCLGASEVLAEQDYVFSGSEDATVKMWDIASYQCVHTFEGHMRAVLSIKIQPGFINMFTASEDGSVHQWSIETGQCCRVFEGHWNSVTALLLVGSNYIVTGSSDKIVRRFRIEVPSLRELCVRLIRNMRTQDAGEFGSRWDDVRSLSIPDDAKDAIVGVLPVTPCDIIAEIDVSMIRERVRASWRPDEDVTMEEGDG